MNVGFIGLGHMGAGMAANLLKAGHRVTVFNRTPAKAEALIAHGATLATSIAEASRSDAVVTMLADDEAVENVVLGRDGVIANLPAGGLHLSSSTISVALSERLTEAHNRKSQRFVAAPLIKTQLLSRRPSMKTYRIALAECLFAPEARHFISRSPAAFSPRCSSTAEFGNMREHGTR
jgi:3-hydroxyisobutyrate dehydrogenase-like beta-hydroxyacid dehydrogenase